MASYPDDWRADLARARYFETNGFGDDGGYSKAWDWFKLGPIPLPVPNGPARVRALKYHDLHHVLTEYDTDWRGEFEISAWEVAGGCGRLWVAWALNLGGLFAGALLIPRRCFAAFVRGRHSRNLYGEDPNRALRRNVGELRAEHGLDRPAPPASLRDRLAYAGWFGIASAWAAVQAAVALAPLGAIIWWWNN